MGPGEASKREIDTACRAAVARSRARLDPWMAGGSAAATLVAGYAMAELDRTGRAARLCDVLERARLALADWSAGARVAA
jgi:hypothetical protein